MDEITANIPRIIAAIPLGPIPDFDTGPVAVDTVAEIVEELVAAVGIVDIVRFGVSYMSDVCEVGAYIAINV